MIVYDDLKLLMRLFLNTEVPDSVPLTDEEKAELDRRLDAYHRDPTIGSPWAVVREKLKSRT